MAAPVEIYEDLCLAGSTTDDVLLCSTARTASLLAAFESKFRFRDGSMPRPQSESVAAIIATRTYRRPGNFQSVG